MSDTSETKTPFNKWWFISAGLVVVIVAGLAWILIINPNNESDDAAPAPSESSSALPEDPASTAPPVDGECNLDDSDQEIPTEGPDAEWVDYGPLKIPTSPVVGPARSEGPVMECFAHTPTGALFAATYLSTGLGWNDYEAVAEAGIVQNDGVDAWLSKREAQGEMSIQPGQAPAIAGFRFESYTGDAATVQLGLRYGDVERMTRVDLKWDADSNDWKADVSQNDPTAVTNEVTSITNFTPWGVTYG